MTLLLDDRSPVAGPQGDRFAEPLHDAELRGLVRDGEVVSLGPALVSSAAVDDRQLRLRALALVLPGGVVGNAATAAWTWGVTGRWTLPVEACVDVRGRHGLVLPGVRISEVVLPEHDVDRTGPVAVTTRLRTTLDLLRGESWCAWRAALVGRLLAEDASVPHAVRARLDAHRRLPYKRRALARLHAVGVGLSPR